MSNCSFANQSIELRSKNYTNGRTVEGKTYKIDTITPHQVWGHCSMKALAQCFQGDTQASSNYGIVDDGSIGMFVPEDSRSWCSSSRMNDVRAVTIECCTDKFYPNKCTDEVLNSLLRLCIDICQRNGIRKMIWIPTKEQSLDRQKNLAEGEGIFTLHEFFYNKDCPGAYIKSKMQWLCDETNKAISQIHIGDVIPMEVYDIKDGYAYGKAKIEEPQPTPTPVPEELKVGDKVTINPGAKAGGLSPNYRGKVINPKYANGKFVDTVADIATHYGVKEAKLKTIVTWVDVNSLNKVG